MKIEFKVSKHPSGNHTLEIKRPGEATFSDCAGELFANADQGAFYKAVAATLAAAQANGDDFSYRDMQ